MVQKLYAFSRNHTLNFEFWSLPGLTILSWCWATAASHICQPHSHRGKQPIYLESFFFLINLFIYFCLCWVFVSVRGLSPVAASRGHSSSRCAGLSLSWPLPLRSTGSRGAGSVVAAHGPSRSAACGIFPDQTRARTRVPCIGRQILNHCATREAQSFCFSLSVQ